MSPIAGVSLAGVCSHGSSSSDHCLFAYVKPLEKGLMYTTNRLLFRTFFRLIGIMSVVMAMGRLPGVYAQAPTTGTATVLVMDVSGSMNDPDGSGLAKLEGAKGAGLLIANAVAQENSLGTAKHQAGLVTFNEQAQVISGLTTDATPLTQAIQGMAAEGNTNIGDALERGLDVLEGTPSDVAKILILLSDGLPTAGIDQPQQFLDGPVARAVSQGTCIYTIGLGAGGEMNADLLRIIAEGSGCGAFYLADEAFQLRTIYMRLRHETTGENVQTWEGTIQQGEDQPLGIYPVPSNQELIDVSLVWPGSKLQVKLTDPNGTLVEPGYPGVEIFSEPASERLFVRRPAAGNWSLSVLGVDVPEGKTAYSAAASSRTMVIVDTPTPLPTATPTATPLPTETPLPAPTPTPLPPPLPPEPPPSGALWLFVLGGIVTIGAVAAVAFGRRRRSEQLTWLEVTQGAHGGHQIPLRQAPFRIGRAQGNDLVLNDPSVSRQHAVIRHTTAGFEIEDLGSAGGIMVNGRRVTRTPLNSGDLIALGATIFRFHSNR